MPSLEMNMKNSKSTLGLAGLMGLAVSVFTLVASAAEIRVDFDSVVGPVKPVNGVGQPPMLGGPAHFRMMHYLKEAGITYSRLHDVGGWLGQGLWVDIPNLFPDFDADETDPKNYRFDMTDALLKALVANGVEPYFRLGITIENFAEQGFAPRRSQPPKDFAKWGRICEHVIRHYTEGWAEGHRMKITYWEIWNEPENNPDLSRNPMFRAPFSEYIRFYGIVAPYLKAKFPYLKIGGYGSCGYYAGVGSGHVAAAHSSPRMEYFVTCSHEFLKAVKANGWPLDFFSFHSYSAPEEALRQIRFADEHLNEYGFTADRTERHFNEWLPYVNHDNLGTAKQASGIATELIELQNGPCAVACIYDARCGLGNYSPLFNPMTYKPHKAYYAFMAFNELRKLGQAVKATTDGTKGLSVCAAKKGNAAAIFCANDTDQPMPISCKLDGYSVVSVRYTDGEKTDAVVSANDSPADAALPPRSFAVVLLKAK